jgi:hypothetical protein
VITRREFLRATAATAGIVTVAHHLPATSRAEATASAPAGVGSTPAEAMRHRIDGLPKVRGEKVYVRDLRARDMPGWPAETHHVLLLRAQHSDRPFLDLDLSGWSDDARPTRIVVAEDLARDRITSSGLFLRNLLLPRGKGAEHAGQPVAMLIFDSFRQFRQASRLIGADVARYGNPDPSVARDEVFGTVHYIRSAGTPADVFSRVKDGWHDPDAVGIRCSRRSWTSSPSSAGIRRPAS